MVIDGRILRLRILFKENNVMRRYTVFAILSLLLINVAQAQSPKGKLFIIGGGSRPDAMVARIIEEAGLQQGG